MKIKMNWPLLDLSASPQVKNYRHRHFGRVVVRHNDVSASFRLRKGRGAEQWSGSGVNEYRVSVCAAKMAFVK